MNVARYLAVASRTPGTILDLELVVPSGPSLAVAGPVSVAVLRAELDLSLFCAASHPLTAQLSRGTATAATIGADAGAPVRARAAAPPYA